MNDHTAYTENQTKEDVLLRAIATENIHLSYLNERRDALHRNYEEAEACARDALHRNYEEAEACARDALHRNYEEAEACANECTERILQWQKDLDALSK